jgi:hypothetical protein
MAPTDTPNSGLPASRPDAGREHRVDDRYSLGDAFGHLKYRGSMIPCQFIDISLSGCRIRLESPFTAGALAPVHIVLLIFGLVLRMDGVTQWSRGCDVGIRFSHPSFRSKNQLAGLLICLSDNDAKQTVQEVFSQAALDPVSSPILSAPASSPRPASAPTDQAKLRPSSAPPDPNRTHPRTETAAPHEPLGPLVATDDEWPTLIRFPRERTHTQGVITGLNQQGCAVRTAQSFPGTMNSPVEISFHIRGLPFQLRGSVAQTGGQYAAQIRFLELSLRKREELQQVLDELQEAAANEELRSE